MAYLLLYIYLLSIFNCACIFYTFTLYIFISQSLYIGGTTGSGGSFKLWVQDMYPTTALTFTSSTSAIASALTAAANALAEYDVDVECTSFSVTKALLEGGTALQLNITFITSANNGLPLSPTTAFVDDLTGMLFITIMQNRKNIIM